MNSAADGLAELLIKGETSIDILRAEIMHGEGAGDQQMPNETDEHYAKRLERLKALAEFEMEKGKSFKNEKETESTEE